jgi:hypothetical protein
LNSILFALTRVNKYENIKKLEKKNKIMDNLKTRSITKLIARILTYHFQGFRRTE